MRVLYVATNVPYPRECGGTTHVGAVTRELARRGHEVVVCARDEPDLGEGEVEGAPVHRFRWRYRDIGASQAYHRRTHGRRLARLARDHAVDVIYERDSSMGGGYVASRSTGLPLAVEVNDLWYHPPSLERAGRIVAISGAVRSIIPERHHGKTAFIHNAVDAGAYQGVRPAQIGGAEGHRLVGYTGSLLAWHGIEELAYALPRVVEEEPRALLVVAGEPTTPEGQRNLYLLKYMARGADGGSALRHLGRVPHDRIPSILAACEVCVAPFNPAPEPHLVEHGFWYSPLKLFEYLAAGRAVVSTDIDNVRDILGGGRGSLVRPGDPDALARAIVELLQDDARRARMGELGRAYALENTWERRVDVYERALEEAASGGG